MMISSWFLAVAILGTPKAMSAYFVLMGVYFLVNRRSVWLAGAMIGLGYLSHPEASIGAIGCAVYLLWGLRKSLKREGWSYISSKIGFFIAAALVVLPWITWAKLYAGNLANLPFFLMPLDIKGYLIWNDVHTKVGYDKIIDTFLHTPAIDILYVRVINISRTLLNIEFANGYVDPDWGRCSPLWNFCYQHVRALTGAVPFALAPVAYYATLKYTYRMKREFVSLILVPFGLIAFLNGYQDYSLLIMGMDIIIVLIIIAGANLLSAHRRMLLAIYVLMLLEFVAVIWLCFYNPRLLVMYVNNAVEFSVATIAGVGFLLLICYSYWSLRDTNKRIQSQMPS
jgi:hypothetical protein